MAVVIDRVEQTILKTTKVAFEVSKKFIPYGYLDNLARSGLDKAEMLFTCTNLTENVSTKKYVKYQNKIKF